MYLIKSDRSRLRSNLHQIIPYASFIGIHPRQPALIPENLAVLCMHSPLRHFLCQIWIPKCHDSGNQIDVFLFTLLHQRLYIGYIPHCSLNRQYLLRLHLVSNLALIILNVDDHGIQLRLIHQLDQIIHPGDSRHRSADIDTLNLDRLPARHLSFSRCGYLLLRHLRFRSGLRE